MKISFYYVDAAYIHYLKEIEINTRGFTTVPNVEYANQNKFVYGAVLTINNLDYYVPISSYKKQQADNILIKIDDHKKQAVRGSMRFNYMFPVPKSCLIPVNFKDSCFSEQDRIMLRKEYKACLKMLSKVQKQANKTYFRVTTSVSDELTKNSCMFQVLELACKNYLESVPNTKN